MPTFDELWPVRKFRGITGHMLSLNPDTTIFMQDSRNSAGTLTCVLCTLFTGSHYKKEKDVTRVIPNRACTDRETYEIAGEYAVRQAASYLRRKALEYTRRADEMETLLQNYPPRTDTQEKK